MDVLALPAWIVALATAAGIGAAIVLKIMAVRHTGPNGDTQVSQMARSAAVVEVTAKIEATRMDLRAHIDAIARDLRHAVHSDAQIVLGQLEKYSTEMEKHFDEVLKEVRDLRRES